MNKLIVLLLMLAAPLSSQAWTKTVSVPLLAENENESDRFGYHIKCRVTDDIAVSIEISPIAAVAVRSVVLGIWDESGHHMNMQLGGIHQKDGTIGFVFSIPKAWAEKSVLCIVSDSYNGSTVGKIVEGKIIAGYSVDFKNALKK